MALMATVSLDISKPIKYCEDWAVGIPLIDSQHLRLFEMIEDLRLAVVNNAKQAVIAKVLKGLIGYCGEHFECEQMLMQTIGFPTFSGHLAIHQHFTDQTLKWFDQFQAGNLDLTLVLQALMDWLVSHILENDKKITACCIHKGIDTKRFVSVSDVIPKEDPNKIRIPVELGMVLFMMPVVGLFGWLAFWQSDIMGKVAAGISLALILILFTAMVLYVRRTLNAETRGLHLAHAKQLADNMLASEIAKRVAVMNLDDIEQLFENEASPLVRVLQEIVDHIRIYLPYLPETLLAIVRGEGGDEEEEVEGEEDAPMLENAFSLHSADFVSAGDPGSARKRSLPMATGVATAQTNPSLSSPESTSPKASAAHHHNNNAGHRKQSIVKVESMPSVDEYAMSTSTVELINLPGSTRPSNASPPTTTGAAPARYGSGVRIKSGRPSSDAGGSADTPEKSTSRTGQGPSATINSIGKARNLLDKWMTRKSVSVLFTDVSGFNHLVNTLPIDEVLSTHARYVTLLEEMGKVTKGMVNSLVGDRVIMSWNAATNVGAHAQQACKAALLLREALKVREPFANIKVKSSICTGSAHVGNMGSKSHLSFCIVGPVMIFASALCKLNAFLGTDVLIDSNTWRDAKQNYVAKMVAPIDIVCPGDEEFSPGTSRDDVCRPFPIGGGVASANPTPLRSPRPVQPLIDPTSSPRALATSCPSPKAKKSVETIVSPFKQPLPEAKLAPEVLISPTAPVQEPTSKISARSSQFTSRAGRLASVSPLTSRAFTSLCKGGENAANAFEIRRMFALELLGASEAHTEGEWMYVLQTAGDPFVKYHEALMNLFYGSFPKGFALLEAYVKDHQDDYLAADLMDICAKHRALSARTSNGSAKDSVGEDDAADNNEQQRNSLPAPDFTWMYGWRHPA